MEKHISHQTEFYRSTLAIDNSNTEFWIVGHLFPQFGYPRFVGNDTRRNFGLNAGRRADEQFYNSFLD